MHFFVVFEIQISALFLRLVGNSHIGLLSLHNDHQLFFVNNAYEVLNDLLNGLLE